MKRITLSPTRRAAALLVVAAMSVTACSRAEETASLSTIAVSEVSQVSQVSQVESELEVIELAASSDPLPTGEVVQAVECSEALEEAADRRRAGTLERPVRRDIDPDTVVIDHIEIDDTVAGPDERPMIDGFPAPGEVVAADLNDRALVFLVQLCRGDDR